MSEEIKQINEGEMFSKLEGTYEHWIKINQVSDDCVFDDNITIIYCDTRDFAIGWNYEPVEKFKDDSCGFESMWNKGFDNMENLKHVKDNSKYVIENNEIIKFLKELHKETTTEDNKNDDWRCLTCKLKNCDGWELKYIRFVRINEHQWIVCNMHLFPVQWREIIKNIDKLFL